MSGNAASVDERPAIQCVEWVPLYQVPKDDAWHEWVVGPVRRYESQARQLVKDLAAEYPHYRWRLVKITTTKELFDV